MRKDELNYAFKNLLHRRLRSFLSALSILIGIMSIFALVSFGLGIQNYINTVAAEAGVDKLFLQAKGIGAPGTDDNFFLSQSDVDFVSKIKGVNEIAGVYSKAAEIEFKDQKKYNFLIGYDMKKRKFVEESFGSEVTTGRSLKEGDSTKVVLGYNYQFENKVLKNKLSTGDKVKVNGKVFEVVGFYEEIGNPSDDANIYMTDDAVEGLFPEIKDKFGFVMIRAEKNTKTGELADRIQEKLRKHKGQEKGKEDFFVQTFEDALQTFTNIIGVINGILLLIALISLVVATVNIMNTMYTAVLEKTKEIGLMKSIGAKNSDIFLIFVTESALLGLIGGILGVIFGYLIASAGGAIAAASGFALLKPIFPWYLIFGCLLFALVIGALAGLLPAYQASKLKPVDALRYE